MQAPSASSNAHDLGAAAFDDAAAKVTATLESLAAELPNGLAGLSPSTAQLALAGLASGAPELFRHALVGAAEKVVSEGDTPENGLSGMLHQLALAAFGDAPPGEGPLPPLLQALRAADHGRAVVAQVAQLPGAQTAIDGIDLTTLPLETLLRLVVTGGHVTRAELETLQSNFGSGLTGALAGVEGPPPLPSDLGALDLGELLELPLTARRFVPLDTQAGPPADAGDVQGPLSIPDATSSLEAPQGGGAAFSPQDPGQQVGGLEALPPRDLDHGGGQGNGHDGGNGNPNSGQKANGHGNAGGQGNDHDGGNGNPDSGQKANGHGNAGGQGNDHDGGNGNPDSGQKANGHGHDGGNGNPDSGQKANGHGHDGGNGNPNSGQKANGHGHDGGNGNPNSGQNANGHGHDGGNGNPNSGQKANGHGHDGGNGNSNSGQNANGHGNSDPGPPAHAHAGGHGNPSPGAAPNGNPPPAEATPIAADVTGTEGDDVLVGTDPGGDVIAGLGGNDDIRGLNGSDVLHGDAGNDVLRGQGGSDQLYGGDGDDVLVFDAKDSVLDGGAGTDTLKVVTNVNLSSFAGSVSGIEAVDMTAAGKQTLTLAAQDVLDMSDTDVVTVDGGKSDVVNAGNGWSDGGVVDGYHLYTKLVGGATATLALDIDLKTNADLLS